MKSLHEMQRAGHHAKDLMQRILSFSRRTTTTRRVVSMQDVLAESVEVMRATAPKTLSIQVEVAQATSRVGCLNLFSPPSHNGVGKVLGMPVVPGILRDHQAAITVRSQLDMGSSFTVIFRAAEVGLEKDADAELPEGESDLPGMLLNLRGHLITILYVDDDELITELVEPMLKRAGFSVNIYVNSKKALDDVRSDAVGYDLAIVDYMMPWLNGLDLAKELRRLHPGKPVAITSGPISEELLRDAPLAWITELIHKANTGIDLLKAASRLTHSTSDAR